MGQRHQIYLRTKEKYYNEKNPNNKKAKTFAIHHQWLYGHTAIRLLNNYLNFMDRDLNKKFNSYDDPDSAFEILKKCYSFDHTVGYSSDVYDITDECADDPRKGDNNNGITIIDFEDGKLKYAFMSYHGLECMDDSVKNPFDDDMEFDDENQMDLRLQYQNFEPIDVNLWIQLHYGRDWNDGSKESKEIAKLIKSVNKFELLSKQRIAEIFPDMVVRENNGEGLYIKPNSVEFIENKAQTELEL